MTGLLEKTLTRKSLSFDEKGARDSLEEVLRHPIFPFERDQVMRNARRYIGYWFLSKISEQYPLLSTEIFSLKRTIKHDGTDVKVPTLFHVDLIKGRVDDSRVHMEVKYTPDSERYGSGRTLELQVEVPELTPAAREAYEDARVNTIHLVKEAYDDPLKRRILLEDGEKIRTPDNASYRMVWAPEEIKVKNVTPVPEDPAIVMTYWGANFILYKWNTPKERPIDAFLREFSESFPEGRIVD